MKKFFDWLLFKLFDQGDAWLLEHLPTDESGGYTTCGFYRRPRSHVVKPWPLVNYLITIPEQKEILEQQFKEMGYELQIEK